METGDFGPLFETRGAGTDPGVVVDLAPWRARRERRDDVPMGAAPFVLEEVCPGCGSERVVTMVWRPAHASAGSSVPLAPLPLPRMEPHFECQRGRVLYQEITDAPLPVSEWARILGRFREESAV
jgi:hypothetical protein